MNLSAQKSRLTALTRQIGVDWKETKARWTDSQSREFDSHTMVELQAHVDRAILVIEKLETLLGKIRSDCE